ncbi:MAG: hypothetical protein ACOYUZ_00760 [Patescibacteria group bacterium]
MSWKNLFKKANKLGMPIIVTNEEAKNPMVILSLDAYEDLVNDDFEFGDMGMGLDVDDFGDDFDIKQSEPDSRAESAFEFEPESIMELPDFSQESEKMEDASTEEVDIEESEITKKDADFSLEDRFYFEPLEDEAKK